MPSLFRLKTLSLALSIGLLININLLATATLPNSSSSEVLTAQTKPTTPRRLRFRIPGIRPSGNLEGGAARGGCTADGKPISIIPLLPLSSTQKEVYPGSTVAAKPKILIYIPATTSKEVKFTLLDLQNTSKPVYEGKFTLTGTPGIVSFSPDKVNLEVGKTYRWSMQLICDPNDSSGNPLIKGEVKRIQTPATLANVRNLPPMQQVELYTQADVWYDAVGTLAALRSDKPNDTTIQAEWSSLLDSVNLGKIAQEPIVTCCTPTNN